ncbi:MAG: hypothetical protein ACI4MC_06335 [Candidatus Coproplasma sp.]
MFSLNVERGKFLVVRGGVDASELMDIYKMPVDGELYEGRIIEILPASGYCRAQVNDSYEKIAERYNCDQNKLIGLNKNAVVYPTKRIWLP